MKKKCTLSMHVIDQKKVSTTQTAVGCCHTLCDIDRGIKQGSKRIIHDSVRVVAIFVSSRSVLYKPVSGDVHLTSLTNRGLKNK